MLENLKPFNSNDHYGLAKLSTSLRSAIATMQLCGFEAELNSYSNVELVFRKLLPKLQEHWANAVWREPRLLTLVDLSDFVSEISMIEYTRRLGVAPSSDRGGWVDGCGHMHHPHLRLEACRPRKQRSAVADIEKMFYQVSVRPDEASVFRYLWREPRSKKPADVTR